MPAYSKFFSQIGFISIMLLAGSSALSLSFVAPAAPAAAVRGGAVRMESLSDLKTLATGLNPVGARRRREPRLLLSPTPPPPIPSSQSATGIR